MTSAFRPQRGGSCCSLAVDPRLVIQLLDSPAVQRTSCCRRLFVESLTSGMPVKRTFIGALGSSSGWRSNTNSTSSSMCDDDVPSTSHIPFALPEAAHIPTNFNATKFYTRKLYTDLLQYSAGKEVRPRPLYFTSGIHPGAGVNYHRRCHFQLFLSPS